jgi:hypothetical protein
MTLTSDQLLWFLLAQVAFGGVMALVIAFSVRDKAVRLRMVEGSNGGTLLLKVITIIFICTISGNLALMKILDSSAVAAIFGGVLGYVFGSVNRSETAQRTSTSGGVDGDNIEKEKENR